MLDGAGVPSNTPPSNSGVTHTASFQLDTEDVVGALRSHWGTMAGWTFSYACIAIMWIAAAGAWLWGGSLVAALALTGGAVGAPVYLAAIYWLYLPKVGRRQFAQYAALRDAAEMSWNSVAVTFSSVRYTSRTSWSDYRRWAEDSRVYRVYPVDGQYHVIPKRAFTSPADEAAFRACLESIGKPAVRG